MNTHRQFSIPRLIILIVGLAIVCMDVAAGPLKVHSADPNSGTQGQEPFEVEIKGIGFTNANKVRFLVSKSSNNTGRVVVDLLSVDDDETITAEVDIPDDATVADYDIEVQLSNGRKGKGTTLFRVKKVGDEEISTTATTAHWTFGDPDDLPPATLNTVLELTGERLCGPGGSAPLQAEHSEYACGHEGEVYFNLTGGIKVGKKGKQAWCENFNAITLHNTSYNYVWNGDCTTGECWIHIFNWAYQSHVMTLPDNLPEPVGLLWIEAFADLPADFPLPTTQPNPYVENLALDVNEVLVIYKAFGKNRTMVKCSFTQNMGEVVFYSDPVLP